MRKEQWITLVSVYAVGHTTPDRRQSEKLILSMNVDKKSLETGDWQKWQLKTLFLVIFDPCSSITKSVFDCRLSGVLQHCK